MPHPETLGEVGEEIGKIPFFCLVASSRPENNAKQPKARCMKPGMTLLHHPSFVRCRSQAGSQRDPSAPWWGCTSHGLCFGECFVPMQCCFAPIQCHFPFHFRAETLQKQSRHWRAKDECSNTNYFSIQIIFVWQPALLMT